MPTISPERTNLAEPELAPVKPVATPHLDLRRPEERRLLSDVDLKLSAVEAGVHTHTCPQCGLNPGAPVVKKWQYVPPWIYIGLLLNILVLLIMYAIGKRSVKAQLNLCADCDSADRTAQRVRGLSVLGIIGGPLAFAGAGGALAGEEGAIVGAAVGLVAGIVGIVAAHRRTRFDAILCRFIDKKQNKITLRAAGPFRRVLSKEAPDALL